MSRTSERRARRAAAQRKQQPAGLLQNRNVWIYGGVGLAVIVFAILGFTLFNQGNRPAPAATTPGSLTPVATGAEVAVPNMGGQHIQPGQSHAAYNSTPPTSGPHYETAARWGRYDQGLPEETWVHNLEHGGIVMLTNCPQSCPDLVNKLDALQKDRSLFSKFGYTKFIIAPYNKVPNRLTLVAWNYYLSLDDYDDAAVRKFITAHQDKGPEPDAG